MQLFRRRAALLVALLATVALTSTQAFVLSQPPAAATKAAAGTGAATSVPRNKHRAPKTATISQPGAAAGASASSPSSLGASAVLEQPLTAKRRGRRPRQPAPMQEAVLTAFPPQQEQQQDEPALMDLGLGLPAEERLTQARVRAVQRAALCVARQRQLAKALGRAPTVEETCASLGLTPAGLRTVAEQGALARAQLVLGWKALVEQFVWRFRPFLAASEAEELVGEGYVGVVEAALRFRPGKGGRFGTYVYFWVKKRVLAAAAQIERTAFASPKEAKEFMDVQQVLKAGLAASGAEPSLEEVADAVALPKARVAELLRRGARRYKRLEQNQAAFSSWYLADTLLDEQVPEAADDLDMGEVEAAVAAALERLPEEERLVLAHRLGLTDGQPKGWEELARMMEGCSVSYLRKVEARAKAHLRRDVEVVKLLHRRPPALVEMGMGV